MAANAAGKVVRITKDLPENGNEEKQKTVLDTDAVVKIFDRKDVVNSPVAIYCIAGMLRKGKSFFLNLVMRYLKFKVRNKAESWLDDKTVEINEGFEWRGGSDAHTKGIWIWSEPFWIDVPKYGKVAVFLMDTQGIGDETSSPETDANLFSLSALLSSYHIYNMSGVMNTRDLDQLKTFTEFGKKLLTAKQELHQTLLFLMRDWQDPEYEFGFDGGSEYLEKAFTKVSGTSEHYKDLCDNIKTSFKEVKCALLPHPGKKFVSMKKKNTKKRNKKNQNVTNQDMKNQDIKNQDMTNQNIKNQKFEDIDDDFLEEVEDLLDEMFSEICVKHNGEYPLTGNDIIDQATRFSRQMETPDGINAEALYSIVSQSFLANVVASCEEKFSKGARNLHGRYHSNEELSTFHVNLVKEVLSYYDSKRKVSSEENIRINRRLLDETFMKRIFILKSINKVTKQGVKELYRALVKDCIAHFKDTILVDLNPDKTPRETFIKYDEITLNVTKNLAMKRYKNTVSKNPISYEISNEYQLKLEKKISLQKKLFKSLNYYFSFETEKRLLETSIRANDLDKEGLKKDKFQLELLAIKEEIAKKIHLHLIAEKKKTSTDNGNRCDQLDNERDKLLKMFRKVVLGKDTQSHDLADETKKSLEDFFNHATEIAKTQDEIQKDEDLEAAEKMKSIWIMRYTEHMEEFLRRSKVSVEKLNKVHDKFLKKMCKNLDKKSGKNKSAKEVLANLKSKMGDHFFLWSNVNIFHGYYFTRELSVFNEFLLNTKKSFHSWLEGDFTNMVILSVPSDWDLPENAKFLKLYSEKKKIGFHTA